MNNQKTFTAISLFAGCGGLDYGFDISGIKTIWANDIWATGLKTFSLNYPNAKIICKSICEVKSDDIPYADVLLGGFPCQPFSIIGARTGLNHEEGKLFFEYLRVVKDKKPKVFIAENVPGLVNFQKGELFNEMLKLLSAAGYFVTWDYMNVLDYGGVENRKRVIIAGFRNDLGIKNYDFPYPVHIDQTVEEYLKRGGFSEDNPNIKTFPANTRNINDISDHTHSIGTITLHTNRVARWSNPIDKRQIKHFSRWTYSIPISVYTLEELAYLYGFPTTYKWNKTGFLKQIGNSVSPIISRSLGQSIYAILGTSGI